jgi:hypothetical protein
MKESRKMKALNLLTAGLATLAAAACTSNNPTRPGGGLTGAFTGFAGSSGTAGSGTGGSGPPASGTAGSGAMAGATGAAGTSGHKTYSFHAGINRNIDVVFMVDDSASMQPLQDLLTASFSKYTDALQNLPGGLPNLHLGVVSSSMGAGRNPGIDHCPQGGDQGVFHSMPLGATCAQATLAPGQNFITNTNGMANYTGTLADVFGCIAKLGDQGCGFEHQLESVLRALGADGAAVPAANANFLRPDAYLQIVLLTNEDDCSAPPDSDLFDSTSSTIADPLGPMQSYRCNEFGHLCGGMRPPRQPMGEVDLGMCMSAEDGRLIRVADVVKAMKGLKADPSKVLVAAIAGPATPYKVNIGPSQFKGDPDMWPYVEHSCQSTQANGGITYADPAVRIKQWVDGFGDNGVFEEICGPSLAPALQAIGNQVGKALGVPCLPVLDPTQCTWVDQVVDATGKVSSTALRECTSATDAGPCWFSQGPTAQCLGAQSLRFNRPTLPAGQLTTIVTCP